MKILAILAGIFMLGQIAIPTSCSSAGPAVADVIAGTQLFCQFVPTANSVETILKANSTITTVTAAVQAICGAVGTPPAAAAGAAPSVADVQVAVLNGAPVVGHFVAKK